MPPASVNRPDKPDLPEKDVDEFSSSDDDEEAPEEAPPAASSSNGPSAKQVKASERRKRRKKHIQRPTISGASTPRTAAPF